MAVIDDSSADSDAVEAPSVSWENDLANAHNWSTSKKIYNTAVPGFLCLFISFTLAMYSPFHSKVQEDMHTSSSLSILPFTLYVYGLAFGPAVAAPLSETFGRRSVYIMATPVAMLFILGAGFSRSISSLAVCRLLAGIAISAPLAVGAGTILDMWSSLNANRAIILLMTTAFLGPALGSLAGGWISQYKDWPWSQWTSLFLGAATWIFALGAKESYAAPLIRRRAIRHNLPIPPSTKPTGWRGLRFMATVTLARPVMMLVKDPVVLLCSLYSSLNFSILFSFLASIPLVYGTVYDFSPGQSGLVFISITIGSALGGLALIFLDAHTFKLYGRHCKSEPSPPERMLWGAMIGGPLMAVALFWFAWTSQPQFHWVISILATGLFGFSNILIFVSTMLYLTNLYGAQYGASASAANGLLRYIIGGSFPLFTETMYNNLTYPWASSLLGFLALAFAFLPWIFYILGGKIRKQSSNVGQSNP